MILYSVIGILVKAVLNFQKTITFILPVKINTNIISYIASFVYNLQDSQNDLQDCSFTQK